MSNDTGLGYWIARRAALSPQRTALVYEDHSITYAEFNRHINRAAHALRATAATNALSHEADIAKVQEWLGHANVSTTRLYDRRKMRPEDKRRAPPVRRTPGRPRRADDIRVASVTASRIKLCCVRQREPRLTRMASALEDQQWMGRHSVCQRSR